MWMNEECYDLLLEASEKVQQVLNKLRDSAHDGEGQPAFDSGYLNAAQKLLESEIPDDYEPFKKLIERRCDERMEWAMLRVFPHKGL